MLNKLIFSDKGKLPCEFSIIGVSLVYAEFKNICVSFDTSIGCYVYIMKVQVSL